MALRCLLGPTSQAICGYRIDCMIRDKAIADVKLGCTSQSSTWLLPRDPWPKRKVMFKAGTGTGKVRKCSICAHGKRVETQPSHGGTSHAQWATDSEALRRVGGARSPLPTCMVSRCSEKIYEFIDQSISSDSGRQERTSLSSHCQRQTRAIAMTRHH